MNEREIRRLTPKEYFWYFRDKLDSLVRKTFSKKEILVFVSYQPDTLTLDYNQVQADTSLLFSKYKYVEVLEKTFKTSRRYNDGDYIGGYHSHLIMKESDYKAIENQLSGMDIVAKLVYNLDYINKSTIFVIEKYFEIIPVQLPYWLPCKMDSYKALINRGVPN